MHRARTLTALALALVAASCGGSSEDVVPGTCLAASLGGQVYDPGAASAPELPTGFVTRSPIAAHSFMVVANHPLAAKAGCDVLERGGTAIDAAVAVQMVLGLVEPQSSGIGGGGFLVYYDAAARSVTTYDGRETAPAAATENYLRWISDTEMFPPVPDARASGRSIGTPGILRLLETAHADAGKLPWRDLLAPAIRLAGDGIRVSPRLAQAIQNTGPALARDAEVRASFLDTGGRPLAAGARLARPALAQTLQAIADGGAAALYTGAIARDIVDEVADTTGGITPGAMTLADLAGYRAIKREPICIAYRDVEVCGMAPPSSGGIAVAQILGILARFELAMYRPTALDKNGGKPTVTGVHLVSEAERLAYADRDRYVADPDAVPLPGGSPAALLDPGYLQRRADLISLTRSLGTATPGAFPVALGDPPAVPEHGTTQITIIDGAGNAVALTSSIESDFGSFHMTRGGVLLNNQLTDFSAEPSDGQSAPIANRVGPGKRPRSSMSPTLVFRRSGGQRGDLVLATGSPGGAAIIQYVTKALVGVIDWGLDAQQATAMVDFGAANSPVTSVGDEHPNVDGARDPLVTGLTALGHTVSTAAQTSGLGAILVRTGTGGLRYYEGGADPRREGAALGDTFRP